MTAARFTKARLSMEAFRDVDAVVATYGRGRISASKARELCEAIVFDGQRLASIDPANLGASLAERVAWAVSLGSEGAAEVAARLDADVQDCAVALCRLAIRGRIERVAMGRYRPRCARGREEVRGG